MNLNPDRIAIREKLILTGMFLSKYSSLGLNRLGFRTYIEAYNVIGYALGAQPLSIRGYRDEFDPIFPNSRKGWYKRDIRDHCKKILDEYNNLDIDSFASLIKSFVGYDENALSVTQTNVERLERKSGFAQRMITGLAAERYFETFYSTIPEFQNCLVENTTRLGCGYDFRIQREISEEFIAVEVKGIRERIGSVSLTPREYDAAAELQD